MGLWDFLLIGLLTSKVNQLDDTSHSLEPRERSLKRRERLNTRRILEDRVSLEELQTENLRLRDDLSRVTQVLSNLVERLQTKELLTRAEMLAALDELTAADNPGGEGTHGEHQKDPPGSRET